MASRFHDVLNVLLGTFVGAGVSFASIYFDFVDIRSDEQRFAVELFEKWQKVMTEAKNSTERLAWLNRLDSFIESGGPAAVKASIELTQKEIKAEEIEERKERLAEEAEEAKRERAAAEADSKERRAAEEREREAREAAERAAAEANQARSEIELRQLKLGYTKDEYGRIRAIP